MRRAGGIRVGLDVGPRCPEIIAATAVERIPRLDDLRNVSILAVGRAPRARQALVEKYNYGRDVCRLLNLYENVGARSEDGL